MSCIMKYFSTLSKEKKIINTRSAGFLVNCNSSRSWVSLWSSTFSETFFGLKWNGIHFILICHNSHILHKKYTFSVKLTGHYIFIYKFNENFGRKVHFYPPSPPWVCLNGLKTPDFKQVLNIFKKTKHVSPWSSIFVNGGRIVEVGLETVIESYGLFLRQILTNFQNLNSGWI